MESKQHNSCPGSSGDWCCTDQKSKMFSTQKFTRSRVKDYYRQLCR